MDDRSFDAATTVIGNPVIVADPQPPKAKRRAARKPRGATVGDASDVAFGTLVMPGRGIYGLFLVVGPSPEDARRVLGSIRDAARDILIEEGLGLRDALVDVNDGLLSMNADLPPPTDGESGRKYRAQVTLLARRAGGFDVAYVGCHRLLVVRRRNLLPTAVRPQEKVAGDMVYMDFLGTSSGQRIAQARVDAEGGDLLVLAPGTIVQVDEVGLVDALEDAARGEGLQELADQLGAIVTIPVKGVHVPETGRANGISWAAFTSTGMRPRNEDAYHVNGNADIFALGDGLGGHNGGAVASRIAVDTIAEVYAAEGPWVPPAETAARACELAGARVTERTSGGGTTIEALRIRDGRAHIAHIGDSCVYLFRDGELEQLTADHSLVADEVRAGKLTPEAARTDPRRNIVTRAIGTKVEAPDIINLDLQNGDLLVLCSDGLTGPVDDEAIASILQRRRASLPGAARALVDAAYEGGALDNVTVVLVRVMLKQTLNVPGSHAR